MNTDLQRENSRKRNRVPFIILLAALVIVLVVVVLMMPGNTQIGSANEDINTEIDEATLEKWQEGVINYNGKNYIYNRDIKSYLIMGVDKDEMDEDEWDYTKGGQADAIFLLVTNAVDESVTLVSIHRNTLTRVETCGIDGKSAGYVDLQLCLQHAYGDGKNLSCVRMSDAVSHMFYNLPIHGYISMYMEGMPIMNDAIGGVEVTVLDDLKSTSRGVDLKKGQTVTLSGDEAYVYLRSRDIDIFDSATNRLKRQQQYITAYIEKLEKIASDNPESAVEIYESLSDYIVSSVDFASLVGEVKEYSYTPENMHTVPGEVVEGTRWEEFHIDEEAFYDMIIDIFYEEVTE